MFGWFKKKIYIPVWFFIFGRSINVDKYEYYEFLEKVSESLMNDKIVIAKMNGIPIKIWKENKEVKIEKLKPEEYHIYL